MGRRDAVQVTLEVVAEMRRLLPALVVSYEPGWETRGNGLTADFEGGIWHHTASFSSEANPFPTQHLLVVGRSDLTGPLCNESVPWCTVERPRLHVVAAFPANHAGASGGRSMGPLPVTRLFNPKVRGLEIDYSGTTAMTAGQLLVAYAWGRANAKVLAGGDIEHIRAHAETSVTGKVDVGYAAGKTYDMAAFRRGAAALTTQEGFLDMLSDQQQTELYNGITTLVQQLCGEKATLAQPWPGAEKGGGWPVRRYNTDATRLSLVDIIRDIDQAVNSRLDLTGRPVDPLATDTAFGHTLSARAEVRKVLETKATIASAAAPVDPVKVAEALAGNAGFINALASSLAAQLGARVANS